MTPAQIEYYVTLAGSFGIGAVVLELIRRHKSKEDRTKIKAEGDSVIVTAVTAAFTGMTTGLREEIERLQAETHEIRERASSLDSDLRAALVRVDELARQLNDKTIQCEQLTELLEKANADLERIRQERDIRGERILQLEGDVRQLNTIIESGKRVLPSAE